MADVIDDTRSFTISLTTPPPAAPRASIASFTPAISAQTGTAINICDVLLSNIGGAGSLYLKVVDTDTNTVLSDNRQAVAAGGNVEWIVSGTMPNHDWHLKIEVGHVA